MNNYSKYILAILCVITLISASAQQTSSQDAIGLDEKEAYANIKSPNIEFEGLKLEWAKLHTDNSLVALHELIPNINTKGSPYDMFFQDTKLVGDQLISLFRLNFNVGSYISATDVRTGKTVWGHAYNLTNNDYFETYTSITAVSNGNIELAGTKAGAALPQFIPFGPAISTVLNVETGITVNKNVTTSSGVNNLLENEESLLAFTTFAETLEAEIDNFKLTRLNDESYILVGKAKASDNCLQFHVLDKDGQSKLEKTICHPDDAWTIIPEDVQVSGNGNIIVASKWIFDNYNSFPASFSVSQQALGLGASTPNLTNTSVATNVTVYPNPVNKQFQVKYYLSEGVQNIQLNLTNLQGQTVFTRRVQTDYMNEQIDVSSFPAGIYFLHIRSEAGILHQEKIVVK